MSGLTRDDVAHVAKLARLELEDEELDRYTGQLAKVLEHARDLEAFDLEGTAPTAHPFAHDVALRDDTPAPCLDRDEVLAAAPLVDDDRFVVPPILGAEP